MADKQRFKWFTSEEIRQKQQDTVPKATLHCDKKWHKVLTDYLTSCGSESLEYWLYPDDEFNEILAKFRFEVRSSVLNDDGDYEPYSVASLRCAAMQLAGTYIQKADT